MNLVCVRGEYHVSWLDQSSEFDRAQEWCYNQFGSGWGDAMSNLTFRNNTSKMLFIFKKLNHAQWFMLKFKSL